MTKRRELTEEQKQDARRLYSAFEHYKLRHPEATQESLANECGWKTQGAVSQYLTGKVALNPTALSKFCRALGVSPHDISPKLSEILIANTDKNVMEQLVTAGDNDQSINSAAGSYILAPAKGIPLLTPNQATQWMEALHSGEFRRMPYPFQNEIAVTTTMFYVSVSGDANYPTIKHGDVALIDPERTPKNENFVLVEIGGDVSIRQYIREAGDWWLIAKNANYPPKPSGSATIIGVVLISHEPPNIKYHV